MVTLVCYYCVFCMSVKRPFCIIFDSTRIWVLGFYVCVCVLSADASCFSSHYYCFFFIFFLDYHENKIFCDTFTLFSSFLDCESKNSKRKSSAHFLFCMSVCVLNLSSNSLEKTKQIKQIVCGGGCCLGKRAKLAIGVWGGGKCQEFWH